MPGVSGGNPRAPRGQRLGNMRMRQVADAGYAAAERAERRLKPARPELVERARILAGELGWDPPVGSTQGDVCDFIDDAIVEREARKRMGV